MTIFYLKIHTNIKNKIHDSRIDLFKEGVGRVLWFRQSAPTATTSATQEPGTSKNLRPKGGRYVAAATKFYFKDHLF